MWEEPESVVGRHLASGEKLLWSGKPRGGIRLRASDAMMIPFSLMWGGFAIFWESMVLWGPPGARHGGKPVPIFMALWGIPFVLVGLYIMVGRFFVDAKLREKTFYGITNQRIVIVSGLFSSSVKSLNLPTLAEVTLSEKSDGSGTITLGAMPSNMRGMVGVPWPGASRYVPPSLEMIEGVSQVYNLIRKAQLDAGKQA